MKKIILGLAACAALWACSDNDEVSVGNTTQKVFDGDVAYMTVRINDVGSTTTRATDGGYQYGTADEHNVANAYFYFYDANGVFVSEAEVWDGGNDGDGINANVEFEGNTVIVLKGLTGTGYPNYVVTVLNKPANFKAGSTLTAMAALLADESSVGITDASGNFVMSTSSYVGSDNAPYYFVTPVTADDFFAEPIDMDEVDPVDIYVERLAAKVETGISLAADATTGMYPLTETVAGDENTENTDSIGADVVYVKINGWALNGTAKHSNIVKDITGLDVSGIDGWTGWNVPGDYRSYWGKSFNYGLGYGQYPTTSEGASNAASSEKDGTSLNTWLDYVSYNDLTLAMNGYTYCAENTNTAGGNGDASAVIQTKNSSAITNVLLAATVCDANGNGLDLVRYQGELFTKDAFLNYVMTELQITGAADWNVYTLDNTTGEDVYTQIDATYLTLGKTITSNEGTVTRYDGYVVVLANEDVFTEEAYYYNTGTEDAEGNPIMEAYDSVTAAIEAVNASLYAFDAANDNINAYTGGAMYYHIPIEHLNNEAGLTDNDGNVVPLEANYGVVRNHWYQLTITDIENLGKGVFDPDEVIIPNIDDDKYYYVGAQINILSWKIVGQNVSL